jgi:hypothetical protein
LIGDTMNKRKKEEMIAVVFARPLLGGGGRQR